MASVYRARDNENQSLRAIKEMSVSKAASNEHSQAVQNFLGEAKILSRLKHPNLPAFTDFFMEGPRHYLVMEYIDGQTLDNLLEQNGGPFPEGRVLSWAKQLCDVLEYLHGQNQPIIFRDVKPANIMLTRKGRIKLIDFGIARIFRPNTLQDTQQLGTPGFAPPEQYGTAQTNERSDIYSLAVTLFQLMTDNLPEGFGLRNISEHYPQISPVVARALEKATELDVDKRYESMEDFHRALLGEGIFLFEHGDQAETPEELVELCRRYPDEALDYLYSGEIEDWFEDIGAIDLKKQVQRIRDTMPDEQMGLRRFFQIVGDSSRAVTPSRGTSSNKSSRSTATGIATVSRQPSTTIPEPSPTLPASKPGRNGQSQTIDEPFSRQDRYVSKDRRRETPTSLPVITAQPALLDFGEVRPGFSNPKLLTIDGENGAYVQGSVESDEDWIYLDPLTFEGKSKIQVSIDSRNLPPGRHTGTILLQSTSDNPDDDISVQVRALVLPIGRPEDRSRTIRRPITRVPDELLEQLKDKSGPLQVMPPLPPRPKVQSEKDQPEKAPPRQQQQEEHPEHLAKYSKGGDEEQREILKQELRLKSWLAGVTAFMAACFPYTFLMHWEPLHQINFLPPGQWFTLLLLLMFPLATLGAILIHWRRNRLVNQICSGLAFSLTAVSLAQFSWQSLMGITTQPIMQLFMMILVCAVASSLGTNPRVSDRLFSITKWAMKHTQWLVMAIGVFIGGILGLLLSGFSFGCLTGISLLVSVGVFVLLVMRMERYAHEEQA